MEFVVWDRYREFLACPEWERRTYQEYRAPKPLYFMDHQHLARREVHQKLLALWANEEWWRNDTVTVNRKLAEAAVVICRQSVSDWREKGRISVGPDELRETVVESLSPVFLAFKERWLNADCSTRADRSVETSYKDMQLVASLDLEVIDSQGEITLFKGRVSKKKKIDFDDLAWQVFVASEAGEQLATKHFSIVYQLTEFREFLPEDDKKERHSVLDRLFVNAEKATPSSASCRICPHQAECPDKYKPKKRTPKKAESEETEIPAGRMGLL